MSFSGHRWLRRLAALEASVLSDHRLQLKQWLSWLLLLGLIGYCGAANEWQSPPSHFDYLQDPSRFEAAPVYMSYVPVTRWTHGPGYLFRTLLGWVPIRDPYAPAYESGTLHSLQAVWHADGTVTVVRDMAHPLRALKSVVSAVASVVLVLALIVRYRPRSAR